MINVYCIGTVTNTLEFRYMNYIKYNFSLFDLICIIIFHEFNSVYFSSYYLIIFYNIIFFYKYFKYFK